MLNIDQTVFMNPGGSLRQSELASYLASTSSNNAGRWFGLTVCSLITIASLVNTAVIAAASAGENKAPSYQDFVVTNVFKGKPAAVDLSSHSEARHFRTELRRQAAEGPNFAGHYKIAMWGCGTSCQAFAIVDSQNGRVYFPPDLPYVSFEGWNGDDAGLQFRINSRLLVLKGSPKEEPRGGTFYYEWQTNTLRLIHAALKKADTNREPPAE